MSVIYLNDKVRIKISRSSWVLALLQQGEKGAKPYWKDEKHLMSLQSALHASQQAGYADAAQTTEMRTLAQLADDTLLFAEQGLGYLAKLYGAASQGLDAQWSALFDGPTLSEMPDKQLEELMKAAADDPEMLTLLQLAVTLRTVNGLQAGVVQALTRE